jgi:hypothetical protein
MDKAEAAFLAHVGQEAETVRDFGQTADTLYERGIVQAGGIEPSAQTGYVGAAPGLEDPGKEIVAADFMRRFQKSEGEPFIS